MQRRFNFHLNVSHESEAIVETEGHGGILFYKKRQIGQIQKIGAWVMYDLD